MGFLDNLLKKETKKIISDTMEKVMDTIVEPTIDAAKEALGQTDRSYDDCGTKRSANTDEKDCCNNASVVKSRIRKILAANWSNCEIREKVTSDQIGANYISWKYTYGIYRDGYAVAMINILDNPNDYRKKIVLQSKQACADQGIGYVHFLLHLPNRSSYIEERLKEIIPA